VDCPQGNWTGLRAVSFRDMAYKVMDYGALALLALLTLAWVTFIVWAAIHVRDWLS
jgi:hypothetical protein